MALITDKKTTKILQNRLDEFTKYSMVLYYLYEQKRIKLTDLEEMFFSCDEEKSSFIYGKVIRCIKSSDLKKSYEIYSNNENIIDENELNSIYIKKIINVIQENSSDIDKTYINTYNYLLTNKK